MFLILRQHLVYLETLDLCVHPELQRVVAVVFQDKAIAIQDRVIRIEATYLSSRSVLVRLP